MKYARLLSYTFYILNVSSDLKFQTSPELDYLLILRQGFIEHMQLSPAYLKMPVNSNKQSQQAIDKLVAQLPAAREKFDWKLLPTELRPKMKGKKLVTKVVKQVDVVER